MHFHSTVILIYIFAHVSTSLRKKFHEINENLPETFDRGGTQGTIKATGILLIFCSFAGHLKRMAVTNARLF